MHRADAFLKSFFSVASDSCRLVTSSLSDLTKSSSFSVGSGSIDGGDEADVDDDDV
jgi:hypothetical protein